MPPLERMSRVCVLCVCVVWLLWGLMELFRLEKASKLMSPMALPWQEVALGGNAAPAGWLSACSPYQCASQVSLVLLPRSGLPAVPARMSVVVCRCGSPEQRQQTGRSSSWTSLGCLGRTRWCKSLVIALYCGASLGKCTSKGEVSCICR